MIQNDIESDQSDRVVLRSLAVALPCEELPGCVAGREGQRLTVEIDPVVSAHSLRAGELIEVRSPAVLYLGQVRAVRGNRLTVILEHSVNLDLLGAIQHIWNRPEQIEAQHAPLPGPATIRNGNTGR